VVSNFSDERRKRHTVGSVILWLLQCPLAS
jgi:hypothetical protein